MVFAAQTRLTVSGNNLLAVLFFWAVNVAVSLLSFSSIFGGQHRDLKLDNIFLMDSTKEGGGVFSKTILGISADYFRRSCIEVLVWTVNHVVE